MTLACTSTSLACARAPLVPTSISDRSCWVLGRYSKWLLERAESGQRGELDSMMAAVCERCLDHNRRVQVGRGDGQGIKGGGHPPAIAAGAHILVLPIVYFANASNCHVKQATADTWTVLLLQEAACGALSTFLEEGKPEQHMAPYMAAVLQTLASTLQVSQKMEWLLYFGLASRENLR